MRNPALALRRSAVDERRVSSASIFSDDTWTLDVRNPAAAQKAINWHRQLPCGASLADGRYATMLSTAKEYIYQRMLGSGGAAQLNPAGAVNHANLLLQVCDWMMSRGMTSFSEITQLEVDHLREALRARRGKWNSFKGAFVGSKKLKNRNIERIIGTLCGLVALRDVLDDVPDWIPSLDPGKLDSSEDTATEIPAIPDAIAMPLFAEALRWVEEIGPLLVQAKDQIALAYRKQIAPNRRRKGSRSASDIYHQIRRAYANSPAQISYGSVAYRLADISKYQFNKCIRMLEAACFIVVAGFSGMRISELSSLEIDCLGTVHGSDNRVRLILHGKLIKTAVAPYEREAWVVGFDTSSNPVRLAVDIMTKLAALEREHHDIRALFVSNAYCLVDTDPKATTKLDRTPRAMAHSSMTYRLNEFLSFTGLDASWHLTPHQFRKTFARFVARNHRMALLALKRQFKHASEAMTSGYHGNDIQLLELIADERRIEAREALEEILGSTFLGGKLGEQITRHNQVFRGKVGEKARGDYADMILRNGDVPLIWTSIGMCFAFRDTARCDMDASRQGISGCLPCPNFVIALRHLPAWEERVKHLDEFRSEMMNAGVWSDVRERDWRRQRNEAVGVIERIKQEALVAQGGARSTHSLEDSN